MISTYLDFTEAQRADIVRRASDGDSLTAIGRSYEASRFIIAKLLQQLDVPTPRRLTPEQREGVVRMYQKGATATEVAAAYGVSQPAVRYLLVTRGADIRTPVYTLNEDVFDELTSEACYWAGFLFADGCVHYRDGYKTPSISVGLAAVDRGHLVKLKDFLRSSNAVCDSSDGRVSQFSIRSEKIARRLLDLGRYADEIEPGLTDSRHFWRGVVDGDGSVGIYHVPPSGRLRAQFQLVGREALMKEFAGFLADHRLGMLRVRPTKSIYKVCTTSNPASVIIRTLYSSATVALSRKAEAADRVMAAQLHKQRLVDMAVLG